MFKVAMIHFRERNEKKENDKIAKKLFIDNLQKLINIFTVENDDDRLLLAEMYRELGDFKSAKKTLKQIKELIDTKSFRKIYWETKWRRAKVVKLD